MKYWLQVQAPAGNWSDSVGSNSLDSLKAHAIWQREQGETVRIVERTDIEVPE